MDGIRIRFEHTQRGGAKSNTGASRELAIRQQISFVRSGGRISTAVHAVWYGRCWVEFSYGGASNPSNRRQRRWEFVVRRAHEAAEQKPARLELYMDCAFACTMAVLGTQCMFRR